MAKTMIGRIVGIGVAEEEEEEGKGKGKEEGERVVAPAEVLVEAGVARRGLGAGVSHASFSHC